MKNIVKVLVRGKNSTKSKEISFRDLGDGRVRDGEGNTYQMVVTTTNGGVLKGDTNISFRFPA